MMDGGAWCDSEVGKAPTADGDSADWAVSPSDEADEDEARHVVSTWNGDDPGPAGMEGAADRPVLDCDVAGGDRDTAEGGEGDDVD